MDKNEKFRQAILKLYPSVNAFVKEVGIPKTTISSAFKNGIGGMAADKVLMMCSKLNIDPYTFEPLETKSVLLTDDEKDVIFQYRALSEAQQAELKSTLSKLKLQK